MEKCGRTRLAIGGIVILHRKCKIFMPDNCSKNTNINSSYLILILNVKNGNPNAPGCYVVHTLPVPFSFILTCERKYVVCLNKV